MIEVIVPPKESYFNCNIFLAGPITGAPDWQQEAIDHLNKIESCSDYQVRNSKPCVLVANPRRSTPFCDNTFDEQVDWEHRYLRQARIHGVTLFWLAKEIESHPERAYAQTTRFELGEAMARAAQFSKMKLVLGIEEGFPGEKYIRRTFEKKLPRVEIYNVLEDTCRQALLELGYNV